MIYKDCLIERHHNGLYSAFVGGYGVMKADTITGVKRLITNALKPKKKVGEQNCFQTVFYRGVAVHCHFNEYGEFIVKWNGGNGKSLAYAKRKIRLQLASLAKGNNRIN